MTDYGNDKLNEIYHATWPNLGWAARKNTMTHEEMLEEAAKREAENMPRQQVMQIAVGAIDKYSDALKELAAIEKAELYEQLEALKKENFQKVAECCIEEYNQKYGDHKEDPYWVYMMADYFATGEGQTTCLMITQGLPHSDDFGPDDNYNPVTTKHYRAVREFHEKFGTWHLHGLRFLSKEAFYTECAYFIPPVMMKLSNAKCYKHFHTEVHYNFS